MTPRDKESNPTEGGGSRNPYQEKPKRKRTVEDTSVWLRTINVRKSQRTGGDGNKSVINSEV